MFFRLLLATAAVVGVYWAWFHVTHGDRDRPQGRRLYGVLIGLSAIACALGFAGPKLGVNAGLVGGLGLGALGLLLVVGPLARLAARAAVQSDRLWLAGALLEVADVLMPGAGVGEDKLGLGLQRDVRAGKVEDTVATLEHGKTRLPPELGRAIDERIAMLYLSAQRWKDAIDHADRNLFGKVPDDEEDDDEELERAEERLARMRGQGASTENPEARTPDDAERHDDPTPRQPPRDPRDFWTHARAVLGMSPPLWVELLGAVAREGDMDRAATMLRDLELACADREEAFWLVHRGRLVFLAFAGRMAAVERLVAPQLASHMARSARSYWRGVAASRAGDTSAAEGAFHDALSRSRGRARDLVMHALEELPTLQPPAPSPVVREVADAAEAAPLVKPRPVAKPKRRLVLALVAVNALVAAAMALFIGPPGDLGAVVRAGAALRGAIDEGEIWRLASAVFVHIGLAHLAFNLLGLFAVGRWVESVFGSRAMIAIYGVAGLGGATLSYAVGTAPVSAGASGAVFGLVGALLVELALHRRAYRTAWQSGLSGALIVIAVVSIGIGFSFSAMDQAAHLGGLGVGAVMGLLLSPHRKHQRVVAFASAALALAFVAASAIAAIQVARTGYDDTLARSPRERRVLDGIAITVPKRWETLGPDVVDPDLFVLFRVEREQKPYETAIRQWIADAPARIRDRGFDTVVPAADKAIPLPPGWQGGELIAVSTAELVDLRYRVVAAARHAGAETIVAEVVVPDSLAAPAAGELAEMLGSIELVGPAPAPAPTPAPAIDTTPTHDLKKRVP